MRTTYEHGTKARFSFSGGPHTPVNMAESMEEVNAGIDTFAALYCVYYVSYAKFS